jgi:hypothetical protein
VRDRYLDDIPELAPVHHWYEGGMHGVYIDPDEIEVGYFTTRPLPAQPRNVLRPDLEVD